MPDTSVSRNDHMHPVVDLVRHGPLEIPIKASSKRDRKKAREDSPSKSWCSTSSKPRVSVATANSPGQRIKSLRTAPEESTVLDARFIPPPTLSFLAKQQPLYDMPSQSPSSIVSTTTSIVNDAARHKNQKFPFLHLPPELRNETYRLLLTTPNAPIELPRITRDIAVRAREWMKCKDSRSKRAKFKSLFLEVLETCKLVHEEGSSILYGCNIFKFRSCHSEGPKNVVLPTRHLRLLKSIKVSVISREPCNGQDMWVANLLKTFVKDEMLLETFEMSWYGWRRYNLRTDGLVCQTLQLLQAEKQFTVKVLGEARMEKEMVQQLQRNIHSWKVEIHRPVNADTGAEPSDGE